MTRRPDGAADGDADGLHDPSSVAAFLAELEAGSPRTAADRVLALLESGAPPARIAVDVIGAAQAEVGRRWQTGAWSVADEHRATALADAALSALTYVAPAEVRHGRIVALCPHGEAHLLAARLAAECARWDGWEVEFLGFGLASSELHGHLRRRRPDVAVLTCVTSLAYQGAAHAVHACHAAGVPTVIGGAAVTPARARALGAVTGAASAYALGACLDAASGASVGVGDVVPRLPAPVATLLAGAPDVADQAFDRFVASAPGAVLAGRRVDAARADMRLLVRVLAAALLVDDAEVFTDFVHWSADYLLARGGSVGRLVAGLEQLARTPGVEAGAHLLQRAAADVERRIGR